jgi:signal transduction histidine kinase
MRNSAELEAGQESGAARGVSALTAAGVIALTVGILVAAILLMSGPMRERLRAGILHEDGEVLSAAIEAVAGGPLEEESAQGLVLRLLEASNFRKKDVFAFRVFDRQGKFVVGFPKNLAPDDLTVAETKTALRGNISEKFDPQMDLAAQFQDAGFAFVGPVARATVPILSSAGRPIGSVQFLLNGERTQRKLAEVDREVRQYAYTFSIIGGLLIVVALAWAFRRLSRANKLLAERTANLLRANHELTLAAKTSAVGAVAAHLIHGLKNPLFGLQAFVSSGQEERGETEWQAAIDSTKRMQLMIADVVRILQEDAGGQSYELSLAEAVEILEGKIAPMASEASVQFRCSINTSGNLANRDANLLILALSNLAQNAVQASGMGGEVALDITERDGFARFVVSDRGGGLPKRVLEHLFTPCQSGKAGGTGLGLAITKQLANHLGGQLELLETSARGTRFELAIPSALFVGAEKELAESAATRPAS